ncbi:TetR/AcrR family transcriptional regulator [Clostridium magnum]|uniref:Fatty acid metabolism regulator protein n=1 Tax=Clostridium magnum DSM 2767 TaxID=1121326 RepID=A0A168DZU2_9CLOT|nr:TetR/AcrR family transcriptional regulator [Clostridium magnum]KZL93490.1 fatty acid metabolism regulator protein [Clostridium magnum DSM 2767]SHI27409.1 transcriptional regulator, TetR family [Clostridium magnum DSM 2767]
MSSNIPEDKDSLERFLFDENFSEEDITKRQWQIINAATKIFAEKGFEGARTSEIAKEADVAEGTIFRYYKTKKDILMGLVLPLIIKFFRPLILKSAEQIVQNEADKAIEEVLQSLFLDRLDLIENNLPLVKTVFIESSYHPELLNIVQNEIGAKIIPFISAFIEDNIKNDNFREIDPLVITRTLMSLLMGYIVFTNIFPETFKIESDEDEIKKIIDIFLHGAGNKNSRIEEA